MQVQDFLAQIADEANCKLTDEFQDLKAKIAENKMQ